MQSATLSSQPTQSTAPAQDTVPVLYFDGVCTMCNSTVNFVMKHDHSRQIKFASLQSQTAAQNLPPLGVDNTLLESVVLVRNGRAYTLSSAVIQLGRQMGGIYRPLAYMGYILPPFIRDAIYKWVARNRYRWFGKKETCRMPTPEERARFLK